MSVHLNAQHGTLQVNLSFVRVCVWSICVLVGCLSRLFEGRQLERGRRCSCKYLMSSVRYCCPALDFGQKCTPWLLWPGGVAQHLASRQRVRDRKVQGTINLENWSFSLFGFILFVGQRHNGAIKCAIKRRTEVGTLGWLKLWQSPWNLTGDSYAAVTEDIEFMCQLLCMDRIHHIVILISSMSSF